MHKIFDGTLAKLRNTLVIWVIAGIGLIIYSIGVLTKGVHWINLDIGEALSHIGFLVSIVALFHWLIEYRTLKHVIEEILKINISSSRVAVSGIVDFVSDSKKIDYSDIFSTSKKLAICLHYSPSILEQYFSDLKRRKSTGQLLTILALKSQSQSLEYLKNIRMEAGHVEPNLVKIRNLVDELVNEGVKIKFVEHDTVLRYAFISADKTIWVKFYKNAVGKSNVPALKVEHDMPLFKFFDEDIKELIAQRKN